MAVVDIGRAFGIGQVNKKSLQITVYFVWFSFLTFLHSKISLSGVPLYDSLELRSTNAL